MSGKLFDSGSLDIRIGTYRVGTASALADPLLLSRVQEYKRQTSSRMQPIDRSEIATKIPAAEFFTSRKIDGEFTVLVYGEGEAFLLNPGGTLRIGLPVTDEAKSILSDAGVKSALIAGELHAVHQDGRRERIHDVVRLARAPETVEDLLLLHFSVFDLIEVDGGSSFTEFSATWKRIAELFSRGERVRPVPMFSARNSGEVDALFQEHVDSKGAEGLVLRSDSTGIYKVKPRHTLDAVIIGFTESVGEREGMMHDLLLALRRQDGTFHVLCRVGGGFSDDLRRTLISDLKDCVVESEYAEVNSDHVAYVMVEPRLVVEISCLDVISHSTRGAPINRMALDWDAGAGMYRIVRRLPLVSVISPQFVRFRDDKTTAINDIRIDQVSAIVDIPMWDRDARQMTLPASEVLRREVFIKTAKGETMVRKFVMWQTNKETVSEEHPAYVVHYTDFSPNRAAPLAREVRVSNSREQIEELFEQLKEENIKKGWDSASGADASVPTPAVGEPAEAPVKKSPAKKRAAKNESTESEASPEETPAKKPPAKKKAAEKKAEEKTPSKKRPAAKSKAAKKTAE